MRRFRGGKVLGVAALAGFLVGGAGRSSTEGVEGVTEALNAVATDTGEERVFQAGASRRGGGGMLSGKKDWAAGGSAGGEGERKE